VERRQQRAVYAAAGLLGCVLVAVLWAVATPSAPVAPLRTVAPAKLPTARLRPGRPALAPLRLPAGGDVQPNRSEPARASLESPPTPTAPPSPPGVVTGRIQGNLGDRVMVFACGRHATVDSSGAFELPMGEQQRCDVFARRWDGALVRDSEHLQVGAGDAAGLTLHLPAESTGGIGAGIRATEDGVLLERIVDGSGAAEAGLAEGDVITAVDGESVVGMDLPLAQAKIVGAEGSSVRLTVQNDGRERVVDVVRGWVERRPQYLGD